jgi:hypothetical protein
MQRPFAANRSLQVQIPVGGFGVARSCNLLDLKDVKFFIFWHVFC